MPVSNFDDIRVGSGSYLSAGSTQERMGLGTVPTTVGVEASFVAKYAGTLTAAVFVGKEVLATSDTNFITFSITNRGTGGATTAMLAATDPNTTKATGGSALALWTKRTLTLNGTPANLAVAAGDTISLQAAVTGTLANSVTATSMLLTITPS